jgi:arylsulfatase A-like enzyme
MPGLTRKEFLKVAGTGTVGVAALGTSLANAGCNYLPEGGSRMNVIVVIIDSLRKDHVGAYGNEWIQTPNIDALAGESLRFTRAYPESLPTICARRAIHTGRRTFPFKDWNPPEDDAIRLPGWQPIPDDQRTMAQMLEAAGFGTMLVTDTQHQFKPSYNFHKGFALFDFIRGQERDFYKPQWLGSEERMQSTALGGSSRYKQEKILRQYFANTAGRKNEEDWFAPRVFLRASELLEGANPEGQPFFLVVDCFDPHEPWDPPQKYVDLYDDAYDGPEPIITAYGSTDYLTERQVERMRALYAGEVTMVDHWLGNFLNRVNDLGLMENTLLLLLSDHGHALGEHGLAGKPSSALYPELTDVPFMIRHPLGKGAGKTSEYFASTHDVAPTVLGMMGVEPDQPMDGQDLSVILNGGTPETRPHFSLGYNEYVWARDDRYAMTARNDGAAARLYDLQEDPGMERNIAVDSREVLVRMFNEYVLRDAGGSLPNY